MSWKIVYPNFRYVSGAYYLGLGVRILVTMSSDILITSEKVGTKTVTGGNITTYGGDQTYNVWNIITN